MPTYTYKCPSCGHFQYAQGIKEPPLAQCPACQAPVERVIGHVNIVLNAGGFYSTAHKKEAE